MAKAKKQDNFKGMKGDELKKELALLRENLRVMHFKAEGSKSKNVKENRTLRRQIARIMTELNKLNKNKKKSDKKIK